MKTIVEQFELPGMPPHKERSGISDMKKSLGQAAYDAYCETRDWKAYNGDPLPRWHEVRPDIQRGWETAASAVLDAYLGEP